MIQKHSFLRGLVWYAVIFFSVLSVLLILQWNWLAAYENTRPEHVISSFVEKITSAQAKEHSLDSFGFLDTNLISKNEAYEQYAAPYFSGKLTYKKESAHSNETEERYIVFSDETELGYVTLLQKDDSYLQLHLFGTELKQWAVYDYVFDFSFLQEGKSASVTIPMEYSVKCNGYKLGTRYITSKSNSYESLKYLTEYGIELPYMVTYTVSDYLGDVSFEIFDAEGNPAREGISYETLLLNNCSEDEQSRLNGFLDNYLKYYISFMGSPRTSIYENYYRLKPYLLPGSGLERRLSGALEGMAYSNNKSNEIIKLEENYIINLGGGRYVTDIVYDVKTMGSSNEFVTTRNYYRVFMTWNDTGIYADEMISYKNAEVLNE